MWCLCMYDTHDGSIEQDRVGVWVGGERGYHGVYGGTWLYSTKPVTPSTYIVHNPRIPLFTSSNFNNIANILLHV